MFTVQSLKSGLGCKIDARRVLAHASVIPGAFEAPVRRDPRLVTNIHQPKASLSAILPEMFAQVAVEAGQTSATGHPRFNIWKAFTGSFLNTNGDVDGGRNIRFRRRTRRSRFSSADHGERTGDVAQLHFVELNEIQNAYGDRWLDQ